MKRKVMFIVPSLRGGGAEKVMVTLLKHLDRNKYDVLLVVLSKEGKYINDVPSEVKIYNTATNRVRHSLISIIKLIRKLKPDVVFSTQAHLNIAIIALKPFMGKRTKLIVREANTVSEIIRNASKPWVWKLLYKWFYKRADLVVCQSKYMMNDLIKTVNIPDSKVVHIYNPVDFNQIESLSNLEQSPFLNSQDPLNVVALGRLAEQKGFDRLIKSIPILLEKKPEAKLWIIGEGNLKDELERTRDELGLAHKINFVDFQNNPYIWIKHADLFVLSSYYEGLPNALLEAIACNCPVIAVKHPGGTAEIMEITNQEHCYIESLNWEESWFSQTQETAKSLLMAEFNVGKIVDKYERYFQ